MTAGYRGWTHYRTIFRRVKWPSWEEAEEWKQITGGEVEFSAFSDLKVAGSLDFEGEEVPDDKDMVRVYYAYTTSDGTEVMKPLATLMFSVSKPTYRGLMVSGKLDCQSVLSVLSSKEHGAPYTVNSGVNAVEKAREIVESLGLRVNAPSDSSYVVSADHTFDADEANCLTVVNWLLNVAGYASAWVDAYGVVQLTPYVAPTERAALLTLADDENSIMYPDVVKRSDYSDTPNVVKLYYESDTLALFASASNVDPDSRASLNVRKFEVTHSETVTELAGETSDEMLANLMEAAKQKLIDKSSDIEYVEGKCQYVESMAANNAIAIDYVRAGIDWTGSVTNVSVRLTKKMETDFSARKFLRTSFAIETSGEVLWEVTS